MKLQQIIATSPFQREAPGKVRVGEPVRAKHTINEDDVVSIASVDPRIIRHCHTQKLDRVFPLSHIDLQVPGNWRKSRNHFNPDKVIAAFILISMSWITPSTSDRPVLPLTVVSARPVTTTVWQHA